MKTLLSSVEYLYGTEKPAWALRVTVGFLLLRLEID